MQGSVNRSVVIVSGLLTLLLLCGATLALSVHNGWVRIGADAPERPAAPVQVTAREEVAQVQSVQSTDAPIARLDDRTEQFEHHDDDDDDEGHREGEGRRRRSEHR